MKMRTIIDISAGGILSEKRLLLRKDALAVSRGRYAAFVCVMKPEDFIRLTTHNDAEYEKIFSDEFSDIDDFRSKEHDSDYKFDNYFAPFLEVEDGTGKVTAHEGRHRAAMIAKAGGDRFPCTIHLREKVQYVVSFTKVYWDDRDAESHSQVFDTLEQAEWFENELNEISADDTRDYAYRRITLDTTRGGLLKGAPARSKPDDFKHAAWKKEDMPAQFVGQFNPAIVIPTSQMRFGPVKGYHHHRA